MPRAMSVPAPHFLLLADARGGKEEGHWKFVLEAADGTAILEAEDIEPDASGDRAELLAVVRGLEALDQPSRVTLVTSSRYVHRGMAYGLREWEQCGWTWERFGEVAPVRNDDLWRRLSRATRIHQVRRRSFRVDPPHGPRQPAAHWPAQQGAASALANARRRRSGRQRTWLARLGRLARNKSEAARLACARLGTGLLPMPWLD